MAKSTGYADTLLLAAGEMIRVPVKKFLRQSYHFHQFYCTFNDLILRQLGQMRNDLDIFAYRHMYEQACLLDNVTHISAQFDRVLCNNIRSVDQYLS